MEESGGGRSVGLSAGTNSIIWERLLGRTSPSAVSLSVGHGIPITIYLKGSSHLIKRFHVCWEEPGTHTRTHAHTHTHTHAHTHTHEHKNSPEFNF